MGPLIVGVLVGIGVMLYMGIDAIVNLLADILTELRKRQD